MTKISDNVEILKRVALMNGKECLPDVKLKTPRKGRGKDKTKRKHDETDFQETVIKELKKRLCVVVRMDVPTFRGFADLWCAGEKLWLLECKTTAGKMRIAQIGFQLMCQQVGVHYKTIRTLDDISMIKGFHLDEYMKIIKLLKTKG